MSNLLHNKKNQVRGINHKKPYAHHTNDDILNLENLDLLSQSDTWIRTISYKKDYSQFIMKSYGVKLFLEIDNSQVVFEAGKKLTGHIMLEVEENLLKGNLLVLQLKGFEETEFGTDTCGRALIIDMPLLIAKWTKGNVIEAGQYCFPFEIDLPDWLPASLIVA